MWMLAICCFIFPDANVLLTVANVKVYQILTFFFSFVRRQREYVAFFLFREKRQRQREKDFVHVHIWCWCTFCCTLRFPKKNNNNRHRGSERERTRIEMLANADEWWRKKKRTQSMRQLEWNFSGASENLNCYCFKGRREPKKRKKPHWIVAVCSSSSTINMPYCRAKGRESIAFW